MKRRHVPPPTGADPHASVTPAPFIRQEDGCVVLSMHVQPRSSRNELVREGNRLRAWLMAPPVEGAANEALVALLAETFHVPKRHITLERGLRSREKVVVITGLRLEEALAALSAG